MKRRKKRAIVDRRRTVPERIFFGIMFTVLAVWSAIVLYMFFWALTGALKTNIDYINYPLNLPKLDDLQWNNFIVATQKLNYNGVGFWGMVFNSLWLVVGSTFLGTLSICVTGYVFGQYDFKGKSTMFAIVIFTMLIPIYGSFASNYKLIFDLHLNDSPLYLITSLSGFGGSMMITYGYYKGLARDYREAVYMDGGGHLAAFLHVGFPLGKSIFTAYFLLNFIAGWNNYETPILFFDKMPNLASGLYLFQQEIVYEANNPAYFAGALMVMLPVLILFILFSDKIMGKMTTGGLKG